MYQIIIFIIVIIIVLYTIKAAIITNGLPKRLWKPWYDYIAKYELETMNYGYAFNSSKNHYGYSYSIKKPQNFSLNLYDKVANLDKLDLNRLGYELSTIVEVGCGRGGGLFHLAKKYPHYKFIGLDYSNAAIESAKVKFKAPNLSFMTGDASSLPFNDNSIEMVINVESSHCYPYFQKFVTQVKRVLKPNGYFHYTDFRKNSFYDIQDYFNIHSMEDISLNVLQSLRAMVPIRQKQIQECKDQGTLIDRIILSILANEFVGGTNSGIYNSINSGKSAYILIHAINNKIHTPTYKPLLTTNNIRNINTKQISIPELKDKVNKIKHRYTNMAETKPQSIISTNQHYSRSLLKTLSNDFTKPVLFRNHGLTIDSFKLKDKIQIKKNNKIEIINNPHNVFNQQNIFNQHVDSTHFIHLNNIIKDTLHYDYFDTSKGHATGIHNEMNSTINFQIQGNKEWTLVDPYYSDYFVPFTTKSSQTQYVSLIYGWERLPQRLKIPHYKVTMKQNDMLFVPSWWWHQPVSITQSKHIALRTVHEDTFYHDLFMPNRLYKYAYLLPYIYNNTIPTDNSDLNNGSDTIDYYTRMGIPTSF